MDTKQPEALGGESVRTRHCQQHNHGAAQYVQISFKALEKYVGQQADVADSTCGHREKLAKLRKLANCLAMGQG